MAVTPAPAPVSHPAVRAAQTAIYAPLVAAGYVAAVVWFVLLLAVYAALEGWQIGCRHVRR